MLGRVAYEVSSGLIAGVNISHDAAFETRVSADLKVRFGGARTTDQRKEVQQQPVLYALTLTPRNRTINVHDKKRIDLDKIVDLDALYDIKQGLTYGEVDVLKDCLEDAQCKPILKLLEKDIESAIPAEAYTDCSNSDKCKSVLNIFNLTIDPVFKRVKGEDHAGIPDGWGFVSQSNRCTKQLGVESYGGGDSSDFEDFCYRGE